MPKVRDKRNGYYDNEPKDTYEVYGVRTYEQKYKEYDNSWTEEITEFYIYSYGGWGWKNVEDYEPVDEGKDEK